MTATNLPFDPMAPTADAPQSLCGPLCRATLRTDDAAGCIRFFTEAMHMQLISDREPAAPTAALQRQLWSLPAAATWRELCFDHPGEGRGYTLRVIVMDGGKRIRPAMESRLNGGLSIGFPVANIEDTLARLTAQGIDSTAGIVPLVMTRPDGSSYTSGEIHFRGPEDSYALVVGRPPDLAPVGPIDRASGIGGPAYSAIVVSNASAEIDFYQQVLSWEARRDVVLTTSGPAGGLGLDAGTQFRFVQLFAAGATTGYIVLLDMLEQGRVNPIEPGFANRGIVGWTFPTRSFDQVVVRLASDQSGAALIAGPFRDPKTGARVLSIRSPAGLTMEIEELPQ